MACGIARGNDCGLVAFDKSPPPQHARSTHLSRGLTWLVIVAGSTPGLASVLGVAWPLELASHFIVQAAFGLIAYALLLLIRRRRGPALVALLSSLVHMVLCVPLLVPAPRAPGRGQLRIVSANVRTSNSDERALAAWLKQKDPDFVVLQEIDERWVMRLEKALAPYAHRIELPRDDNFGIGLYSKSAPLEAIEAFAVGPPWIPVRSQHLGRPFTLLAIHTVPPISREAARMRDQQIRALATLAKRAEQRFIVAGDLNATSWSPAFRPLHEAGLVDTRRGSGVHGSWPASLPSALRIALDHVLVSPGIEIRRRELGPDIGSDHLPVYVELGW